MNIAEILKYGTLAYLSCLGIWYATATPQFDRSSKARPLLFLLLIVSLFVAISTWLAVVPVEKSYAILAVTLIMATASAGLFRWAILSIRKRNLGLAFSGIVPGEVVQHGPYRYVRHPLYTAYSIFWTSCALVSGSVFAAVGAVLIIGMYLFAARSEERDLLSSDLAPTYSDYRKRTGLMLPKLFK